MPPVLDLTVAQARRQEQPYAAGEMSLAQSLDGGGDAPTGTQQVLAALLVVLHRYSAQPDLLLGIDPAMIDPTWPAGEDLVPLRVNLDGDPTGDELLARIAASIDACRAHLDCSFTQILEAAAIEPATSHHPLVQVVVAPARPAPGDVGAMDASMTPPDLVLEIDSAGGAGPTRLLYNARLFEAPAMRRLAQHLRRTLTALSAAPEEVLSRLTLVAGDELIEITRGWNATDADFPAERCLHHLIEERVDTSPAATAAVCEDDSLTYAELEERSNRLANHLRALDVGPNTLVGICVERSLDMVIGLLAIAKAGGAYMPLDPSYPVERLGWMLEDADLAVVLTLDRLVDRLPTSGARRVRLDADWEDIAAATTTRPETAVTADDLAYVIYTSGSTGNPKGVVLDHRGRVNNFSDFNRRFAVGPGDRLLALSSLSFDMTAYDVFGILAAGGTIVMPPARLEREPSHWAHLIRRHGVTIWHSAPAMLEMLVENVRDRPELHPRSLRLCLLGGDWIPVSLPDRLRKMAGDLQVISLGGATEASMDSTIYPVDRTDDAWTSIPYGRPMANQLAYVLDGRSQPQPVGVPGELHLGGVGVAWGYLDRPALTAEKFVPNPYSGVAGDRMYRTGDLARYHEDGNLELLGRIDYQVKIRGHRIELGEIEAALKEHRAVREAVVVAKGGRGSDRRLVGYVVPELGGAVESEDPAWDREQVGQWQAVYDETYAQRPDQADPTLQHHRLEQQLHGATDPGRGDARVGRGDGRENPLPTPEESARDRLRHRPDALPLAPDCERYVGTDLSAVGLETIRRQLGEHGLDQVELRHQMADDFRGIEPQSFDLVILNSITQLFPSVDYLLDVLTGAVESIGPGGYLFVGDNRDLRLLEQLHASIQLGQAPASVPREALPARIEQSMAQEEQLLLDPAFFQALPRRLPRLSGITVQIKRGRHHNELTRFRYDVIAAVEAPTATATEAPLEGPTATVRRTWQDETDLDTVRRLLAEGTATLEVRRIPNARLATERLTRTLVQGPAGPATAGGIREALRAAPPSDAVDPEALWELAAEGGYEAFIGHSEEQPESFDVIFRSADASAPPPAMPSATAAIEPWSRYANQPLRGRLNLHLPRQLRDFLAERLPDYMVPTTLVLLDALPLSPNGKVDRKSLPEAEQTRPELDAPLVPPRGALEQVLTSIWEETLGLESIGVHDGFLELGGHSLLATQIQSRIHELFPVEISLRHFFGALTIEGLGRTVLRAGEATGVDVEAAAELVLQYSGLSVEELESALEGSATSEPTSPDS